MSDYPELSKEDFKDILHFSWFFTKKLLLLISFMGFIDGAFKFQDGKCGKELLRIEYVLPVYSIGCVTGYSARYVFNLPNTKWKE